MLMLMEDNVADAGGGGDPPRSEGAGGTRAREPTAMAETRV